VQGLPFQRIADDLGVSRVTVYHHLSEAINIIKRQLNQARQ
jgi:sigma-70, region 4